MAGGTWTSQNKVRPGVYINMNSAPQTLGTAGDRGITAIALQLPWGAAQQIVSITAGQDVRDVLGYDLTAPQLLLVREALKRAQTLLLYRLNTGTKATATHSGLTITAQHGGSRGNSLSIVIQASIDQPGKYEVYTLLDGVEVDKQIVGVVADLQPNAWVTFAGTADLEATAGVPLTGGADGTITNADHTAFLAALELHVFNTVALVSTDNALKAVYAAFVRRLREDEGAKVQAVLENYPTADYEGVISLKNGVILSDGTTLTAAQATAWVAGATAGAASNASLTYQAYDDAVDVATRYTNSQIEAALRAGEFVFTPNNNRAVVEQDINSLTSFTPDKARAFSKNRVIRVLDSIANDIKRIFETFYLGKLDNNPDGRSLLSNEIVNYLQNLQAIAAIQNFDPQMDVSVTQGTTSDSVYVEVSVQPVDAVEKVYMKVTVV
ncbi:phage tail sheath family protein [Paenibacillus sp. SYP-B4298]|uniref:phage tail sheath family protein n=1 Tax=Paenibacillus sp. SYP-B4298 TaxID=2996034 RepID=UPI0022DE4663|nr:phage tail sheath family protein [Paenibacillus sp. SYP-B4298]